MLYAHAQVVLFIWCRNFVHYFIARVSSCLGKSLCLAAGLVQRFLSFLEEFTTAIKGIVQHIAPPIDSFIEFFGGACHIVTQEAAQLRSCLWCKKQRDTRTD